MKTLGHPGTHANALVGRTAIRAPPPTRRASSRRRQAVHVAAAASDKLAAMASASGSSAELEQAASCPFKALTEGLGATARAQQQQQQSRTSVARNSCPPIPGPGPFSLDSLLDVSVIFSQGLHVAMLNFSNKYGPICKFANPAALNGASSWVFMNSPENVQHVCSTNVRNYTQRYLPDIYKYVTHEKGILGSQGAYNQRHRKLCQPPFRTKSHLHKFASVVTSRSQQVAEAWLKAGALETDVAVATQRLTLDIVGLVAFSHDFRQTDHIVREAEGHPTVEREPTDRLLWAVNTFGEVLARVFITPMPLLRALDALGSPDLKALDKAVGTMREAMLGVIQERRQALAAGQDGKDDLLGVLLQAVDDEGNAMTDEELWEDVHDVMGAGHETTATTLAATLYCISAHPPVEAKVAEELQRVLGGRAPTYEDLESLPYLNQCVKEVLRLYPAIPVFPREAAADDILPSGHAISAGDVVFMSSYALGRSPDIWEDAFTFQPERFDPAREQEYHRFQWLPFGAGPRMCLGANFAQMSVTLMAATLLQNIKFTPIRPTSSLIPVEYDITMNFNATGGLHMAVDPRQQ